MSTLSNPQKMLAFALAALLLPMPQPLAAQSMNVVDLSMTIGKSLVIDYPVEIGRISTSSPEVVDAVPATPREFLLHGKGHGSATVVVWAKSGARTMYNITVEHNLDPIKKLLAETFPNEDIRIQSGRDSISLVGRVSSKEVADRALAIATPLAKTVVTNLAIAPGPVDQQIVLKVKFAELNRSASTQFGVNLFSTGATGTIGGTSTNQFQAPLTQAVRGTTNTQTPQAQVFNLTDALNIFAFRPDLNLGAVIRALQAQDILQILAEPNLTTVNGKEASFLAGGEFPVPILQGGGNAGAVTVQFREYGIRLNFNPQITPNGTIKMYVKPEVSTIDLSNAVSLSGFTIPALATRRMETNVELKEGQSFMIAGLLDDRATEQMSRIPGLSNIPILGQLFKSRLERKSKTELIVIVTPEIVKPYDPNEKLPVPEFPREWLQPFKTSKKVGEPVRQTPATDEPKKAESEGRNPFLFWRSPARKVAVDAAPAAGSLTTAVADKTADAAADASTASPALTAPDATAPVATAPVATAPVATAPVAAAPAATAEPASPIQVIEAPAPRAVPAAPVARRHSPSASGLSAIPDGVVNGGGLQ
jgi:pilus assembly protein CpaC